ncbi:glycosyltransferase [bacterium]|nr:glycosyltransferase [bacterium]
MDLHQLVSSIAVGDAISNAAFSLQELFRKQGYRSEIFAEQIPAELAEQCKHLGRYPEFDSTENILIAHYSIASMGMVTLPYFKARKILFYHNVTPYKYWININPLAAFHCLRGKSDLPKIIPFINYGVAFSNFSLEDLRKAGLTKTAQLPLQINLNQYKIPADPITLEYFNGIQKKILIVGRIAPNKKVDEAVHVASMVPNSHLIVAGSPRDAVSYYHSIRRSAKRLKVKSDFLGHITQPELNALYTTADVLLVMSEHEGFCVPILEAFYFSVPVVASVSGAIPETSNGGALLFTDKKPEVVAGLVRKVLDDSYLRHQLKLAGTDALRRHLEFPNENEVMKIIQKVSQMQSLYQSR